MNEGIPTVTDIAYNLELYAKGEKINPNIICGSASYLRKIADGESVIHAHWNYTSSPNEDCMGGIHNVVECSACKEDYDGEYDYCPSCGALMDGKDEKK